MKIHGEVGIMSHSFHAIPEALTWSLSIRRVDDKEDPKFGEYHKEAVPASFLRQLVPDYDSLSWTELKRSLGAEKMFPRELTARSPAYKLNIIIKPGSTETAEALIEQFKKMMSS